MGAFGCLGEPANAAAEIIRAAREDAQRKPRLYPAVVGIVVGNSSSAVSSARSSASASVSLNMLFDDILPIVVLCTSKAVRDTIPRMPLSPVAFAVSPGEQLLGSSKQVVPALISSSWQALAAQYASSDAISEL